MILFGNQLFGLKFICRFYGAGAYASQNICSYLVSHS